MPPDERYAACGAERWQTGRQRHRCAHHAAHRLSRESKETQTDRGVLRLVERYRAAAQTETSRHPQSGVDLHLRGSGLQPGAAEKTGPNSICRVMGTWCLRGRRQRSAKRTHIRGRVRCTPENGRKREHQQRDARFFSTLLGIAHTFARQFDLAHRQIQLSIELDPSYYRSYMFLGINLNGLDRYDEAITAFQKALSLAPDDLSSLAYMGVAMAGKGNRAHALDIAEKLKAAEDRSEPALLLAPIYAKLGLATEMYECLERAVELKSCPVYLVAISEEYRPYHSDTRYLNFLASIGLSNRV